MIFRKTCQTFGNFSEKKNYLTVIKNSAQVFEKAITDNDKFLFRTPLTERSH